MASKRNGQGDREAAVERILKAALSLFSKRGYRATAIRDIAARAGVSTGNVYHHFGSKDRVFEHLVEHYWDELRDPELELNKLFANPCFPDDLEAIGRGVEQVVEQHLPYIKLIYVDVIEFQGRHIHDFYRTMHERFARAYGPSLERATREGRFGEIDPLMGVMIAVRWFFYYFTVEKAFGVPQHLGLETSAVSEQFVKILRYGLLPRGEPAVEARGPQA